MFAWISYSKPARHLRLIIKLPGFNFKEGSETRVRMTGLPRQACLDRPYPLNRQIADLPTDNSEIAKSMTIQMPCDSLWPQSINIKPSLHVTAARSLQPKLRSQLQKTSE